MPDLTVVVLGCGYTGKRVARKFLERGAAVIATTRDPASLDDLANTGARIVAFDAAKLVAIPVPADALMLYSIPVVTQEIIEQFTATPKRVVYLSTTGVYGAVHDVDEHTPAAPETEAQKLRVASEELVRAGPWSWLVLRPAAIYGPERGVHVAMREGRFQLAGSGDTFVSRIHVEDLARHVEAALLSDVTGAYPVADDRPCTTREIAEFCARQFKLPMPPSVSGEMLHETRRADRRVDGRAIRGLLNVRLRYPTYREGVGQGLKDQEGTD